MPLIEAIPNLSEGKDIALLQKLTTLLQQTPEVRVLDVDSDKSANRTVFTLIGTPQAVCQALFDFIQVATTQLDMRFHHGAHPRLGIVDVCPLVPLQDISLEETARFATQLGRRVGQALQIPVYLYEAAAPTVQRKNLAVIRKGEYENLSTKLQELPPDFGPSNWNEPVQKTGACIIGARDFLIAFNINLNTKDAALAKKIASRIRASNGGLPGVKAIGWYLEHFGRAQVSCNITDFRASSLAKVYETCRKEATSLGHTVTGSELVGLLPLEAILAAGHYYAEEETSPKKLIDIAVKKLRLTELKPFDPYEHILEIKAGLTSLAE